MKPKRKRFKVSERQKQQVLFFFRKQNNTATSIAEAVSIPIYHVHKIINENLKSK